VTTYALPVAVVVLKDNPAVHWYEGNGFEVVGDREDAWEMRWRGHGGPAIATQTCGAQRREDDA
jgi:hypothetical protein